VTGKNTEAEQNDTINIVGHIFSTNTMLITPSRQGNVSMLMNEEWKKMATEFRPEQIRAANIIKKLLAKDQRLKLEYDVTDLLPIDAISCPYCCLDIAILNHLGSSPGIAIRMQGQIHEKHNRRLKDEDQKIVLEGNGWIVVDFWYYAMPNLWNPERNEMIELNTFVEVMKKVDGLLYDRKIKIK